MRKQLMTVMAASAAALALGISAFAGTSLEEVGEIDFSDGWIEGTNLLEKEDESGRYVLADMDGNVLSADSYDRIGYDSGYGFITVAVEPEDGVNGVGVISLDGTEVVPCAYGKVDLENEHWIIATALSESTADQYDYESMFGDGYYLIDHVDFYYADDDGTVTKAAELTRDAYKDSNAYGRYVNIESRADGSITAYDGTWTQVETPEELDYLYDEAPGADEKVISYYENGQYGLKDAAGNVIIEPTYGYISSFYGGYAEVENRLESGSVKGLIDTEGQVAVPVEYERIDRAYYAPSTAENDYSRYAYNNMGYYAVVRDNKLGYVDENGNVTCDFTIAFDNCDNYGASALYTDMGGAEHLLAADGTDTDVSEYERVSPLSTGSGMYYKVTDADYNYGIIDWHGDIVAEVKYDDVDLSGDGQYLLLREEYSSPWSLVKITFTPDEAGTDEAPQEDNEEAADDQDADLSSAAGLLESAITLAGTDAAANKDAILSLLNNAASAVEESRPDIKAVIDSAVTLMNTEGVDGEAVVAVLESAKSLLG